MDALENLLITRRGRLWATDPMEQLLPVSSNCDGGDTCEMQREPQKGLSLNTWSLNKLKLAQPSGRGRDDVRTSDYIQAWYSGSLTMLRV